MRKLVALAVVGVLLVATANASAAVKTFLLSGDQEGGVGTFQMTVTAADPPDSLPGAGNAVWQDVAVDLVLSGGGPFDGHYTTADGGLTVSDSNENASSDDQFLVNNAGNPVTTVSGTTVTGFVANLFDTDGDTLFPVAFDQTSIMNVPLDIDSAEAALLDNRPLRLNYGAGLFQAGRITSAVPEPSAFLFGGIALAAVGLGNWLRRRFRTAG